MTTIINTPPQGDSSSDSGTGLIVGVLVAIVLIVLFFIYALPAIRASLTPQNGSIDVNVKLPTDGTIPPVTPPATTGTTAPTTK